MTRRKVTLDTLLARYAPSRRPIRRLLWRQNTLRTWLLVEPPRPQVSPYVNDKAIG